MRQNYNIGRIAGIKINIHITWLLIFAMLTWSLASDYFPSKYHFLPMINWMLALCASILLFASVLLHELSHSIVSKRNKMKVDSITLFFFGGVANIQSDTPDAKTEFKMAIAGPLMSILIGLLSYVVFRFSTGYIMAVFDYLYNINFMLAAFNMIPGYPLDGGRVLRSALWTYFHDMKKATRIASIVGRIFGYFLKIGRAHV
jgi:Zn-dependent protease